MKHTSSDLYDDALEEMRKKTPNIAHAISLLDKATEYGSADASYALATWYLHGTHVEKDLSKGVMLLKRAANRNQPDACYDLAICYEKPAGVAKNVDKAFKLYLRAALYGDKQSFHEVGRCYYYGIGVTQDEDLADIWLQKAEELGVVEDKDGDNQ